MNKYEREVARSQLNAERHTLDELKEIYRQAVEEVCERIEISDGKIKTLLSEIDRSDPKMISVLQSQIYQKKFQQSIKNQLDFLLKDLNDRQYASISEYLSNSYDNGFIGTLYSLNMNDIPVNIPIDPSLVVRAMYIESKLSKRLYDELGEDVELLKKKVSSTISRGIASNMHYSDIARNISNNSKTGLSRAMTITRTEGNRIYNAASLHSGIRAKEKTGADLIKQWDSTLDGLTRPHHRQLDGQVRELDEPFEIGNRKTNAPLQFGIPSEDINCRCIALIKPRWDVDETFTKRDNASGELLEFEGTKDYENFKKRYWKSVDKSQKSGIMRVEEVKNMSINAIELPIEQQHTGKGNPNAILMFGVDLNNRQKKLLDMLPEFDSRTIVSKKSVNMADLSALTAQTGHEFAMFTKGNERLIIRGNERMVQIDIDAAEKLKQNGYRWSGHTHPGTDFLCMQPSDGDYAVLNCFNQNNSAIYNSKGDFRTFEKRGV